MHLPINIYDLINGQSIEGERLEFKKNWNPESILHSICAFANDINNLGGGYVVIGIEENNGIPVLPPVGLDKSLIDTMQKKLLEICHLIVPNYFPIAVPEIYEGKYIFIIWCPGGDSRPYKTVKNFSKNSPQFYYVRRYSSTVKASLEEETSLMQLTAKIPFDDRLNHSSQIEDMSVTLISEYLNEVASDLYDHIETMSFWIFADKCKSLGVLKNTLDL